MKERSIVARREDFKVSGRAYDYFSLECLKQYKKRKIFVLEQDLFSSYILERRVKYVRKKVEEEVIALFNENDDYLIHYEKLNKEKYIMYCLKGGRRIEALCRGASFVKVIPIQFELLNNFKRKIKEKEYSFLYRLDKGVYYIKVKEEKIIRSFFERSVEALMGKVAIEEKLFLYENEEFKEEVIKNYNVEKLKKGRGEVKFEKILFT